MTYECKQHRITKSDYYWWRIGYGRLFAWSRCGYWHFNRLLPWWGCRSVFLLFHFGMVGTLAAAIDRCHKDRQVGLSSVFCLPFDEVFELSN
jgi:hypothetical protein